jgi:mono/diheme cytochrome c family protein
MLVCAFVLSACGAAAAQETGDPEAGFAIASAICAECHIVTPADAALPPPAPLPFEELRALPFEHIANTPGITEMALFAWMRTSHPTMPNIILEEDDLQDVVAYVLSLKD